MGDAGLDIKELINRRRRQVHVHSVIYYHLGKNLIPDWQFDHWSEELAEAHMMNPDLVHQGYEHRVFASWTGDTGMHLPLTEDAVSVAHHLLRYKERHGDS